MTLPAADRIAWLAAHILPYEPALRAWLRQYAPANLDPDAVIQETYGELVRLPAVDQICSPCTLAFDIARAIVLRSLGSEPAAPVTQPDRDGVCEDPAPPARAADLLAALPNPCREIFVLRKVEGLSQREAAQRLGVSEDAVERRLAKAIRGMMRAVA